MNSYLFKFKINNFNYKNFLNCKYINEKAIYI